jgi:hypothetical protein
METGADIRCLLSSYDVDLPTEFRKIQPQKTPVSRRTGAVEATHLPLPQVWSTTDGWPQVAFGEWMMQRF